MRFEIMTAMLASILVAGCATTPTAPPPETPPTMHVIEGRPEASSAIDQLNEALAKVKTEEVRAASLEKETEELRAERDMLRRQLADMNGTVLALQAKVDTLTRGQQEATDALLSSEIEKAVLERRLLEIRLADLRRADEEVAR